MQIVRAVPSDAETLKQINVAAKAHWGYPSDWMARWANAVQVTPEYVSQHLVYAAKIEDTPVGWYALVKVPPVALLDHLWIDPPFIGQGIGRALFQHAIESTLEIKAQRLELEAEPNAVGFYERMGARYLRDTISDFGRTLPVMGIELDSARQVTAE